MSDLMREITKAIICESICSKKGDKIEFRYYIAPDIRVTVMIYRKCTYLYYS